MSLQPANKKPSGALEQDVNVAFDGALQPFQKGDDDKPEIRPGIFSAAQAEVALKDSRNWVFFYDENNRIIVEWTSIHNVITRDYLKIDGDYVVGYPIGLESVIFDGYPRVYYFNTSPNHYIHEAILKKGTVDQWEDGVLNKNKWKTYPYSGLTSVTYLTDEVFIRLRYQDQDNPSKWTFAEYLGEGEWRRRTV